MNEQDKCSLYYCQGSSDKEYHVQIDEVEGGFEVSYRYGRRGSSLTCDKKTTSPVTYFEARKIFDKVVKTQLSKGYTLDVSGAAYQSSPDAARFTGILPQLLNAIDELDIPKYIRDPSYVLQEKSDGERRMIGLTGDVVIGINRKGMEVALPKLLVVSAISLCNKKWPVTQFLIDGEIIGEILHAFDLLELNGENLRDRPYLKRLEMLKDLVETEAALGKVGIMYTPSYFTMADKQARLDKVRASNGEGIVFKFIHSHYSPGRPNSGGDMLKFKFVADATVQVTSISKGKRSVGVSVMSFDDEGKVNGATTVGNVTIPPNYDVPELGDIVSVEYLYAFPDGGCLFQPVYKGKRTDQDFTDCNINQLKYKREEAIAA